MGGGPAVWHRQPVPSHQLQAVLGCELLVVINPAVSDILSFKITTFIIFGSDRSSRSHNLLSFVRASVRPVQVCL